MPRTLNVAEHAVKREAFIDAAQRLMQTKGFEQMSIQDLLDVLDASRGAFYHYFDSKQALLAAIVDRIAEQALASVAPTVDDRNLSATAKLERFFGGIAQFKSDRKALMLEFIKVWFSDHNTIVRVKVRSTVLERVAPILARIIEQGVAEEVFSVDSASETATILMTLLLGFQDSVTELFIARQAGQVSYERVETTFLSFARAFERILAAPPGSISVVDKAVLHEWFG